MNTGHIFSLTALAILFGIMLMVFSVYFSVWRHTYSLGLYMIVMSILSFGCAYVMRTNFKQGLVMFYLLMAIHFASLAALVYYT
jgi:hypothetical protein